ncbi:beta-ketoacyl synthase N-terminal-like domain-containing protein [Ruminiclostridium josui]|uniref:beta-ketoacyl synthase N-terminal-like domain-containing protein n=1 Tax=Ruminiclostridium josui TaxID=1499 RepID=UPI0006D2C038|nr:beta-ketoacyl synthase N-terminal-like domain-containing protein [Ruminiclostridium josui]
MEKIKKYIYEQVISQKISKNEAALMLKELYENQEDNNKDIAVIGMDCRLPKANNINEFWDNLLSGIDCIGDFPENRRKDIESFVRNKGKFTNEDFIKQGYIDDISGFDPAFFNISPAEANTMDPVQRLFLMVVWGALEDAGINFSKISGSKTGVFVGKAHLNEPLYKDFIDDFDMIAFNGSATGILSSRISYMLNLNGPSLVIDTACSSSLVALHTACQSLINNDCEVAIVGGVRVMLLPVKDNKLEALESPDYKLRPFDNEANGTVWGEGVSAVVLKPLSKAIKDRDNIYAVIKGSACNNDGASNGISAPNAYAQEKLIVDLWEKKKINPESISYIEAHGTGTALGDPIEIKGITNAFRRFTNKKQICAIGTAKGNIGHLVASSGLAGLIKVLMAMKHKKIPPTINFNEPNAYINFIESPVYFNDRTIEWKDDEKPLRASVSSFGISGTNSYVIVEEPPKLKEKSNIATGKDFVFTLSAKSSTSLKKLICKYVDFLEDETGYDLEDVCFTVNTGRVHHNHRIAIVGNSIAELKGKLAILNKGELRSIPKENIYYGDFRLVSDVKRERADGLITKSDKKKLDELSKSKALEYVECGKNESSLLKDLCDLYVNGADIPWDTLFLESEARKVSLPKYQFDLKRCWPESRGKSPIEARFIKNTSDTEMFHGDNHEIHPLLGKLYLRTLNQDIYINELNPSLQWVIGEHKVAGNFAMPGVSFIEMALCLGKKYFDTEYIRLADMAVIFPLMLREGETKRIQTIVKKLKGYLEFAVVGETEDKNNNNGFIEYVQGKIYPLDEKAEKKLDIALLSEEMDKLGKINPNNFTQGFIQFGSRWTDCVSLSTGKTSAVVELTLPENFAEDLEKYYLHPALLDMALNALALTVKERYLPFAYKNINIYGPTPSKFYSYIHNLKDSDQRQEMKSYNIDFIDSEGKVFAEIEEYTIKKANNISNMEADNPMFYTTKWVQKDLALNETPVTHGKAIVFKDNLGLGDDLVQELKNCGWQVIELRLGTQYTKTDNSRYEISVDERDYITFINEVNFDGLTHIFHLCTANDMQEVEDTDALSNSLEKSVYSLFSLTKHLIGKAQNKKVDMYIVSRNVNSVTGNEEFLQPQYACVFGLAKVINNEYPDFRCRSIDSDGSISAKDIISIIGCSDIEAQVAFRNKMFYTEEIQPMRTEAIPEEIVEISSDGVYVITGGTGGIGLEICRYLAACSKVNLALVNRSSLPKREMWDEILQKNEDSRLCNILEKLRAIEQQVLKLFATVLM